MSADNRRSVYIVGAVVGACVLVGFGPGRWHILNAFAWPTLQDAVEDLAAHRRAVRPIERRADLVVVRLSIEVEG